MIRPARSTARRSRGLALITVLLVLALAVIIATEMATRLNWSLRRADNWQTRQQGYWFALGAEALARQALQDDIASAPKKTHLKQRWAQPVPLLPVDDVFIGGTVRDLHGCFNLNALIKPLPENAPPGWTPPERQFLERLLVQLGIEDYDADVLSYRLLDWVDSDQQLSGSQGAEDSDYASQPLPYLTPDSWLLYLNEIRPVSGIDKATYDRVKQHLCVRPNDTELAINVNTLTEETAEVLFAIMGSPGGPLDLQTVKDVLMLRPEEGYDDVSALLDDPALALVQQQKEQLKKLLTITSHWFELSARVEQNRGQFGLKSIMHRNGQDEVVIVARSYGGVW